MGRNNYFKFKQFTVQQEKAAMKVGTDGVLLGAWANVDNCKQILDVGAGTGLIALMMAQRSKAKVAAIEIEENASIEAKENVTSSPWKERIQVLNISFQEFAKKHTTTKYDLIVSNPPFFSNNSKAGNEQRNLARHTDSLPFEELITCSISLLNTNGRLAVILPVEPAEELQKLATKNGLSLIRITDVKPNPKKAVNRVLMEFCGINSELTSDTLSVYKESGGEYSEAHIKLSKDFYLRF